jgi:alternate signal-mediated exported protein
MRKHKKLILIMAIVLAVVTAISGATFAWFASSQSVVNKMNTSSFAAGDVQIVEVFEEGSQPDPGMEVNKDVAVMNLSGTDTNAFVRISFAEYLTMALHDGEATGVADKWVSSQGYTSSGASPTGGGTANVYTFPQVFNSDAFTATSSGWVEFDDAYCTAEGITYTEQGAAATLAALTTKGITIMVNKKSETLPDGSNKDTYSFVAFSTPLSASAVADVANKMDKYDGLPQRVVPYYFDTTGTLVEGTFLQGWNRLTKTLNVDDWKFMVFERPVAVGNEKKWFSDTPLTDQSFPHLSLSTGTSPVATNLNPMSALTLGVTPDRPAPPETRSYGTSVVDANLQLVFTTNLLLTYATPITNAADDKWIYNPEDGFFYYIGKLSPSQGTSQLLDGVYTKQAAGNTYANMSYDLEVCMEAIQAVGSALSSSDGFGLGTTGVSGAILTYLSTLADAA